MGSVSSGFCWTPLTPISHEIGQTNTGNSHLGLRGGDDEEATGLDMSVRHEDVLPKGRKVICQGHVVEKLSMGYLVAFGNQQAIIPFDSIVGQVPEPSTFELRVLHGRDSAHSGPVSAAQPRWDKPPE